MIEVNRVDEEKMGTLTDSDELEKAKKAVQQHGNDYFIKAAKEGSKWKFVNYAYFPDGFKCEWCGNTSGPPKHGYFIENTETGERKLIGSICIEKVTSLGGAYRKFEKFRKKINKLQEIKEMERNELVDEVMEVTGDKEKVMIELQEIEEEIEQEKEAEKEARKKRREEEREKKQEKVQEQQDWLEEEGLLKLKGNSDFVNSVLEQHGKGKVLSDKQKNALLNVKEKVEDKFGSIDEWKETFEQEKEIVNDLRELMKHKSIGYPKHREFIRSILSEYEQARYYPKLSENQMEYAVSILEHYNWKEWGSE